MNGMEEIVVQTTELYALHRRPCLVRINFYTQGMMRSTLCLSAAGVESQGFIFNRGMWEGSIELQVLRVKSRSLKSVGQGSVTSVSTH